MCVSLSSDAHASGHLQVMMGSPEANGNGYGGAAASMMEADFSCAFFAATPGFQFQVRTNASEPNYRTHVCTAP